MAQLELNTEYPPVDEQKHIDSLIAQLRAKMTGDYAGKRVLRDAHPKMHGCVRGEFTVLPGLAAELSVGLFATARSFPVWIRLSNQNNSVSPDSKPDIRGMAIKLMGVEGEKLIESDPHCTTHDFIFFSDSRFVTKDVAEFDGLVQAMMGGLPKLAWYFLTHLRALRNLVVSLRKCNSLFSVRYFSGAPSLLGKRAVKYTLRPRGGEAAAIVSGQRSDDFLKEAMVKQLSKGAAVFDFGVQFQVDADRMPIEDPGVTWDESLSPFINVAILNIPAQEFDTAQRTEFGDNLSFNPWRCLPEHRPLGGISRARRQVYQALSRFRHERNQANQMEPQIET